MSELRMKYKHDTGIDSRSYEIKVSTDYDIESDSFIPTIEDVDGMPIDDGSYFIVTESYLLWLETELSKTT